MIQRRLNGSVDFNQPWEAYKDGFGDPQGQWFSGSQSQGRREGRRSIPPDRMTSSDAGEFWLGLEKMHSITGDRGSQMAVQLQDWDGNAKLLQFPIHLGGEDTAYSLQLTEPTASELGATNVSPNGLSLPFSTWDQDHDLRGDLNCAKSLSGKQILM